MPKGSYKRAEQEAGKILDEPEQDTGSDDVFSTENRKLSDRIDEIQGLVTQQAEEAYSFFVENVEGDYVKATDYYNGQPFGDEEEGRSKVVSTDLRDTVRNALPSMMRIFIGPEKAVEFRGRNPSDAPVAAQQTDYINYVVKEDNPAFQIFHSLLKDFYLRRAVVKWWWDETYQVEETEYTGLSVTEAAMLATDDEVEILVDSVEETQGEDGEPRINMRARRVQKGGCEKYAAVPPEEFLITPEARSIEDAPLVGHMREVPRSFLVELGIDEDIIEEAAGRRLDLSSDSLREARHLGTTGRNAIDFSEALDESQQPVLYAELYILVDVSDEGRSQRRLFRCVGPDFEITNFDADGLPGEAVDEVPFAVAVLDPEAHTVEGLNAYNLTGDIQRIKSQIERETLNSLGKHVEPTQIVQRGQVNMADVLNPDVKGVVRTNGDVNNSIREQVHTFVGPAALQVLEYYNMVLESRVGRNQGTGIDADSLQSATKSAVAAQLNAAQQLTEMNARIFAEMLMKPLFKGLLRLSVKHRSEERIIRLRDKYETVDPRAWDATMDVIVNVGLGQGLPEDRIAVLKEIAMEQKEQLLAGSPLVTWAHYRATLAKILEIGGWTNSEEFFAKFGLEEEQAMKEQAAQQQPPPDPAMALVEVEREKLALQAQNDQAKLQLEREKMEREDDRERDKIARDYALREYEIRVKYAAQGAQGDLDAAVERDRIKQEADIERNRQAAQMAAEIATMLQASQGEEPAGAAQ